MNRRMARAKAARKFHAARTRQVRRLLGRLGSVTITVSMDVRAFGVSMERAAAAMSAFAQAQRMARQGFKRPAIDGHSVRLEPGQLYLGGRGGGKRYLGETGPITLALPPPTCGSCGEPIVADPMTGTRCGCTTARRPFYPRADAGQT